MVPTDGLYGFKATAYLKRLVKLIAEEWDKSKLTVRVCNHVIETK